jgi:hypothetical protein
MEKKITAPAGKPPASMMDKIKAFVSPKSTAGTLRDRQSEIDRKIKEAGG